MTSALALAAGLVGAGCVAVGLWLIHPAASLIFAGALVWRGAVHMANQK